MVAGLVVEGVPGGAETSSCAPTLGVMSGRAQLFATTKKRTLCLHPLAITVKRRESTACLVQHEICVGTNTSDRAPILSARSPFRLPALATFFALAAGRQSPTGRSPAEKPVASRKGAEVRTGADPGLAGGVSGRSNFALQPKSGYAASSGWLKRCQHSWTPQSNHIENSRNYLPYVFWCPEIRDQGNALCLLISYAIPSTHDC